MKKQIISALLLITVFLVLVVSLIAYAKGVRLDTKNKKLSSTGLLVVTSVPDGASVYIDDHLTTATNTTTNLEPGEYQVKIIKEGYLPWQKKLKLQQEIVTKTDALLFPSTPELRPLTVNGASNPVLSPDGTKIVFGVNANETDTNGVKAGLYILDMNDKPLSIAKSTKVLVKNTAFFDFTKAKLIWAPDGKSVIALFNKKLGTNDLKLNTENLILDTGNVNNAFLLTADTENIVPKDITPTINITLDLWKNDQKEKIHDQLINLPVNLQSIATASASFALFSPDETKILYEATAAATIPQILTPALLGVNTQTEERSLQKNALYVYDIKEDKNFRINQKYTVNSSIFGNEPGNIRWFPDSKHLILVENGAISMLEYDNTNKSTVYAGPFEDSFVFPWPNASKLVILTTLNKSAGTANLYSLGMK